MKLSYNGVKQLQKESEEIEAKKVAEEAVDEEDEDGEEEAEDSDAEPNQLAALERIASGRRSKRIESQTTAPKADGVKAAVTKTVKSQPAAVKAASSNDLLEKIKKDRLKMV